MDLKRSGISLRGLNSYDRNKVFYEWVKEHCDYYPSINAASNNLPFSIYLPLCPLSGPENAVYITRAVSDPEYRTVMIHFDKGVDGISLNVCRDIFNNQCNINKTQDRYFQKKWITFSSRKKKNLKLGWRRKTGKLIQKPESTALPLGFNICGCHVSVLDSINNAPLGLVWSCKGLRYLLSNGWEENSLTIDELKEILRYWLHPGFPE